MEIQKTRDAKCPMTPVDDKVSKSRGWLFAILQQCTRHRQVVLDSVDKFCNIESIIFQWGLRRLTKMSLGCASPLCFASSNSWAPAVFSWSSECKSRSDDTRSSFIRSGLMPIQLRASIFTDTRTGQLPKHSNNRSYYEYYTRKINWLTVS